MKTIQIENKKGKVKLNEFVTRESIGRMIDEIGKLFGASASAGGADFGEIMNAAENAVDVLDIEINSPGGSVFDGYTIYQEIKSLRERGVIVNATITGMAASMASVICMACDKVAIVKHGRIMIHEASSVSAGNAEALRKTADLLEGISDDIAEIYSQRTGMEIDTIKAMMKNETWIKAPEAVEQGFADSIVDSARQVEIPTGLESENIMALFMTNKQASEKISGLETRVEELESDVKASGETIESLQSEAKAQAENIVTITAERDSASAELATAQATIADQEAIVTAANEKLATFDDEVESKAQAKVSALGFKGNIATPDGDNNDSISNLTGLEKTIAAFKAKN